MFSFAHLLFQQNFSSVLRRTSKKKKTFGAGLASIYLLIGLNEKSPEKSLISTEDRVMILYLKTASSKKVQIK